MIFAEEECSPNSHTEGLFSHVIRVVLSGNVFQPHINLSLHREAARKIRELQSGNKEVLLLSTCILCTHSGKEYNSPLQNMCVCPVL